MLSRSNLHSPPLNNTAHTPISFFLLKIQRWMKICHLLMGYVRTCLRLRTFLLTMWNIRYCLFCKCPYILNFRYLTFWIKTKEKRVWWTNKNKLTRGYIYTIILTRLFCKSGNKKQLEWQTRFSNEGKNKYIILNSLQYFYITYYQIYDVYKRSNKMLF